MWLILIAKTSSKEYPSLEEEDLQQALRYAAATVDDEVVGHKPRRVIRVLLDQGLAPRAAALLRQAGWDALHAGEVGLERAEDAEILDFALRDGRTCVTLDHDFHIHLALSRAGKPSVILLRVQGLAAEGQAQLIRSVYEVCEEAIAEGAAVSC